MKKIILILTIITMNISTEMKAQETDIQLIEQSLNYYLTGFKNNDVETLSKAFHPNATMKWVGEDYKEVNAIEALTEGMDGIPRKENIETRVVSINIAGSSASAQLEIQFPTFTYIDFMHILKIDGTWKVVSKIFIKRERD